VFVLRGPIYERYDDVSVGNRLVFLDGTAGEHPHPRSGNRRRRKVHPALAIALLPRVVVKLQFRCGGRRRGSIRRFLFRRRTRLLLRVRFGVVAGVVRSSTRTGAVVLARSPMLFLPSIPR